MSAFDPQLRIPHPSPLPEGEGAVMCRAVASIVGLGAARPQFAAAGIDDTSALSGLPQLRIPHPSPLPEGDGAVMCRAVASIVGLDAARSHQTPRPASTNPFTLLRTSGAKQTGSVCTQVLAPTAICPLSLRERVGVRASRPTPMLANSPLSIQPIFGDRP